MILIQLVGIFMDSRRLGGGVGVVRLSAPFCLDTEDDFLASSSCYATGSTSTPSALTTVVPYDLAGHSNTLQDHNAPDINRALR